MMMASWRHIWYWHRWCCCCCCFISQTLKNMDLTTLLFKSAVNNSSGQESSGFGNKAATTSYTKNILWKTCSVKNCSIYVKKSLVKYFVSVNVMTANRISSEIQMRFDNSHFHATHAWYTESSKCHSMFSIDVKINSKQSVAYQAIKFISHLH